MTKPINLIALLNFAFLLIIVWLLPVLAPTQYFTAVCCYILFFIAVLITLRWHHARLSKQQILPVINLINRSHDIIQHWFLPLVELSSFWIIVFLVRIQFLDLLLCSIQAFATWILFKNILYYFHKNNQAEISTHYIYDLLSVITIFFAGYATFASLKYEGLSQWIGQIVVLTLFMLITIVSTARYQFPKPLLLNFIGFLGSLLLILALGFGILSFAKVSFLLSLLTYLLLNFLSHYNKNEHGEVKLILEYGLILGLVLLVLWQVRV